MDLRRLVDYLDRYLALPEYDDRSNNGLQVEGRPEVARVGFAVDAGQRAFDGAIAAGVDMVIVHHGLFWQEPLMLTGHHRRRVQALLDHGISLYSAHLPLDAHPEVGNNAEMARLLGLADVTPFGISRGRTIGLRAAIPSGMPLEELRRRLARAVDGPAVTWPFRERVSDVCILAGTAVGVVDQCLRAGVEALICGELAHMVYNDMRDAGLAAVLGGHYATETLGLKALMPHLAGAHGLETVWLDAPTGL